MDVPGEVIKWRSVVENNIQHASMMITVDLVLALIWQESAGNPWAIRYESHYQYFYNHYRRHAMYDPSQSVSGNRLKAQPILGNTEFHAQSQSWGLLQLMGAAARECGFKPEYLSELCDPSANIVFGTKHLYSWGFNYGKVTNLAEALTRWNGSNTYAHEVLAKFDVVRGVTRV